MVPHSTRTLLANLKRRIRPPAERCQTIKGAQCQRQRQVVGSGFFGITGRSRLMTICTTSQFSGRCGVTALNRLSCPHNFSHPDAPDGLMSCSDVPDILAAGSLDQASVYRNIFGENLKPRLS